MAGVGITPIGASDEQAIRTVVKAYGASWNRHDMATMAELFSEDAHWVNVVGWHWPGKTSVVTGHEVIHRTFFRRTEIEIGHIDVRLIGPDVAVCIVHLKVEPFTPPDGVARPASENRLSLVLARQDGHVAVLRLITRSNLVGCSRDVGRFDTAKKLNGLSGKKLWNLSNARSELGKAAFLRHLVPERGLHSTVNEDRKQTVGLPTVDKCVRNWGILKRFVEDNRANVAFVQHNGTLSLMIGSIDCQKNIPCVMTVAISSIAVAATPC